MTGAALHVGEYKMDPITFTLEPSHGVLAGTWTLDGMYLTRNGKSYAPGKAIAIEQPSGILSPDPIVYHGDTVLIRAIIDHVLLRDRALVEKYLLISELVEKGKIRDWPYEWEKAPTA